MSRKKLLLLTLFFVGVMNSKVFGMMSPEKQELTSILTDIHVIQYACGHVGTSSVPRRYKGYSLTELQDKQRSLLPRMRELGDKLTDEQYKKIEEIAYRNAGAETDGTCAVYSVTSGCANQ